MNRRKGEGESEQSMPNHHPLIQILGNEGCIYISLTSFTPYLNYFTFYLFNEPLVDSFYHEFLYIQCELTGPSLAALLFHFFYISIFLVNKCLWKKFLVYKSLLFFVRIFRQMRIKMMRMRDGTLILTWILIILSIKTRPSGTLFSFLFSPSSWFFVLSKLLIWVACLQ